MKQKLFGRCKVSFVTKKCVDTFLSLDAIEKEDRAKCIVFLRDGRTRTEMKEDERKELRCL